jgi:hypothetical protein
MKILVCARHFGYLRNFESVLVELADRGHVLHLAADRRETTGGIQMVERLAVRYPGVTIGWTPRREKDDEWLDLSTKIRLSQDYLRYLAHEYDRAPQLRRRAKERTPPATVRLVERMGFRRRPGRVLLGAVLAALEDGLPRYEAYDAFMREMAPDVVLLTPLIDLGSPQLDLLKSANALGLRTVLGVGSWDHLSSKALIRIQPDLVTVWNQTQRGEAIRMHGLPPDRVVVTGAQCYDQWFGRRPSRSRDELCRDMGLRADRPFVLYVCSSLFRGGAPEAEFTVEWVKAIRASADPRLRELGILVRPHPGRMDEWEGRDITSLAIAFHGGNPIDDRARDDYFDALHYSAAVVGLNTSAFLEAAVAGKPVLAVLPPQYWKSQEGTLHFHYLLTVGGGVLRTSRSIDEHLPQLARAVAGEETFGNEPFVREFIRPFGLDQPCTPRFADAIEALGARPAPAPPRQTLAGGLGRPVLWAAVAVRRRRAGWQRTRKDLKHDLRKVRERALRGVRRPLKQVADHGLAGKARAFAPSVPSSGSASPAADPAEAVEARTVVTEMRGSRRTVVVGPWLSETGFELLYWIPFVRWAQKYGHVRASRVVAVSRGGAGLWYEGLADRYVDVFDLMSVDEFRAANDRRISDQDGQKHYEVTAFDRDIVERVSRRLTLGRFDWLHPGLMYNLFRAFWMQLVPFDLVQSFVVPRRLTVGPAAPVPHLPSRYVAVKFYTNQALPPEPANRKFVSDVLRRLSERIDVVVLQTGLAMDDHDEYGSGALERVHTVEHLMTPANNLDVQTRIISRAEALVGTYGGFSYVGPLLGVKTLSFYSNPAGFRIDHLEVAQRMFREVGAAPYVALRTGDVAALEQLLGVEPATVVP